ncbi:MAG TPA: hypothetical protein VFM56_08305, partial [Solimonas sp.]|nr:hypothetical protein [Solimonas sp.]
LQNATIESTLSGLCVTCSASNLGGVIDAQPSTYGHVYLPLTLLNASLTVTATAPVPFAGFPAGPSAGFVLAAENGSALTASIGSQIVVQTLKGGKPTGDTSSNPLTPLRLDLLGTSLTGSDGVAAHPVFISKTTKDFDAVQITFNTGLLTALSSYRLYGACAAGPAEAATAP